MLPRQAGRGATAIVWQAGALDPVEDLRTGRSVSRRSVQRG